MRQHNIHIKSIDKLYMRIIITNNTSFEWNEAKNTENQKKHGVSFAEAQQAFLDPTARVFEDLGHSDSEHRWFCIGKVKRGIITVRFTYHL